MFNNSNYFVLFQLPLTLPIDMVKLNTQYQQLQRQFHPDNFALVPDHEKALILQKSATINFAYKTLKDPLKAAEYRVSLENIDVDAEHDTIRDSDFLVEQFELREMLDEIENRHDWSALDKFYDEIIQRNKDTYGTLLRAMEQSDWQTSKTIIYRLRYLARLIEQIELLQEKQFDL
ncbi:Fe-S protein assembly co-chaperone HscB [Orbus sturtevantii]|uniref:Fe-S protein assembly co-chaperone HscB n=1 Tax=Orbus sturtevantii TaxID=3074109 RepID=UPI00370D7A24